MARKATINMVAERAGVSRGTVDRVLNQRPHVKPEIYARVVHAMKELGYIPPREEQAAALGLPLSAPAECKLGVLLPDWSGYFETEIMRGISDVQALLQSSAGEVFVERCRTELPEESVERLELLAEKGVHGIALCAKDHPSIAAKVNELYERDIPAVTFNSDISGCRRLCFVGQDLVRSGRVAGELMAKYLHPGERLLVAIGNPEFHAHRLRLQGFCERLYEKGFRGQDIEIIETYNDYALTYQKVREKLGQAAYQGIYMANHSVTGCVEAVREKGVRPHIVSHDLTDASKRLLKNQDIDFVIAQNIYLQGYQPLLILWEYVQKHILPHFNAGQLGVEIICAENIME